MGKVRMFRFVLEDFFIFILCLKRGTVSNLNV